MLYAGLEGLYDMCGRGYWIISNSIMCAIVVIFNDFDGPTLR